MEKKQAKRKAKPRAKLLESIEPGNRMINVDSLNLSESTGGDGKLVDLEEYTNHTFAHIDADILALAIASLGDAPHTVDNIEAAIDKLMR